MPPRVQRDTSINDRRTANKDKGKAAEDDKQPKLSLSVASSALNLRSALMTPEDGVAAGSKGGKPHQLSMPSMPTIPLPL